MLPDMFYRLRALLRPNTVELELDDELRLHLEYETAKHIRSGKTPEEAIRLARLALGGAEQAKEACRDARGIRWWDVLTRDVQLALRQIRRNPGFSVVTVAVLAMGIGANTAIFSLLNEVMLRSLPVKHSEELIMPKWGARSSPQHYNSSEYGACFASRRKKPTENCSFSYPEFERIASRDDLFSGVAGFAGPSQVTVSARGPASLASIEFVSGDFFRTLGVRPAAGRMLAVHDDQTGSASTVVLSFGYWQSAFGGERSVVGKTIRLNRAPFVIAGVAEQAFNRLSPGRSCDLWVTVHSAARVGVNWIPSPLADEHSWWLGIIGRLRPGVTPAHAEATLSALVRDEMISRTKQLKADSDLAVEVAPADHALIGIREMLGGPLYILMCAVGLVLLIACANVAGLTMARGAARSREMAIRLALGAGRSRLVGQLLTESLLLAFMGAVAGLAIAFAATRSLALLIPGHIHVQPDLRILAFTAAIAAASGILFGIAPALHSTRVDAGSLIHSHASGLQHAMSVARRRRWFANSLVIAQVALAVLMLAGAGLLVRTLLNLRHVRTGFDTRNLLLFALNPVSAGYGDAATRTFYETLHQRLGALPGVSGVTYLVHPLLSNSISATGARLEGRPDLGDVSFRTLSVGPDYFSTMGIPLLAGRTFSNSEFASERPVALVSQAFADRYLQGRTPLGLHYGGSSAKDTQHEIIGVVADTSYADLRDPIAPTIYEPLRSGPAYFAVRTEGDPAGTMAAVRRVVHDQDADVPIFDMKTQSDQIDETLAVERLLTRLAVAFGLLALVLSCTGLYGLLSYEITRRTREIGIRMAIGAEPRVVRNGVLRETLAIVATGIAVGLPCALVATRALGALLYGVKANDAGTLACVVGLLLVVASVAAYVPARRAARVEPLVALRCE